jgi:hypothetical protein
MWDPVFRIDGQQVYASGTIVSPAAKAVDMYPLPAPYTEYRIELVFTTVPNQPGGATPLTVGPNHFRILLQNVDQVLGTSNTVPIYVANYMGRRVILNFTTYVIGAGATALRTTHYTLSDGGPVG